MAADRHDWEANPRPYDEVLSAWRREHGWSWQQVAAELREPLATVRMHTEGRYPKGDGKTAQRRRLMTLIDRLEGHPLMSALT